MDKNIKRVTIPIEDLPAWGFEQSEHIIRYRIISDDRVRFTHWSPLFKISNNGIDPGTGVVDPTNPIVPDPEQPDLFIADYIDLLWNVSGRGSPRPQKGPYDVFVRWIGDADLHGSDYALYPFELLVSNYTGTSLKVKTVSAVTDEIATAVEFVVQRYKKPKRGQQPEVNLTRYVYRSDIISLVVSMTS